MNKRQEKIEALEARLAQLKAREQLVRARQRTLESRRARKADTRRKILVGAVVLAKVEQGVLPEAQLRGWLEGALMREDDRALFGLAHGRRQSGSVLPDGGEAGGDGLLAEVGRRL